MANAQASKHTVNLPRMRRTQLQNEHNYFFKQVDLIWFQHKTRATQQVLCMGETTKK